MLFNAVNQSRSYCSMLALTGKHALLRALLCALLLCFPGVLWAAEIHCPGAYAGHLQGIALDAEENIYWCFTTTLVKTDAQGALLKKVAVPMHHGDVWVAKDTLYVAVNHKNPEKGARGRRSYIYAYATADLRFLWKKALPELRHAAGGLAMREGHFFVVSGRILKPFDANILYEYDAALSFVREHRLESGQTYLGIQTMAYSEGAWWFGCYGNPPETLRADAELRFKTRFDYNCALGIFPRPGGGYSIGRDKETEDGQHRGWIIAVEQPAAASPAGP